MNLRDRLLMRAFGRPEGLLGEIGGRLMVRGKARTGQWLIKELDLKDDGAILEVGCGPGVVLGLLAKGVPQGRVVGIDPSPTMLRQARKRNAGVLKRGRVEILHGEAESLPVADASFDVLVAINSVQVWQDPGKGLQECVRVLRCPGLLCIGFTPEAGSPPQDLDALLRETGFKHIETQSGGGAEWTLAWLS